MSGEKWGKVGMYGNYSRSLDDKRRVIIPSKFRNELVNVLYITLGPDKALIIRSKAEFDIWSKKLLELNMLSKDARNFSRLLLGNSIDIELDKQGRVMIPENIALKSGLTKEVVFVGMGNNIELWDKAKYENFEQGFASEDSLDELAEKLHGAGVKL